MAKDPDDFMARYRREEKKRIAAAKKSLRYLAGALRFLGVQTVTAPYDGYGDDGTLEEITFAPVPPAGLPDGLREALREAFYQLLPGGWEINEGSFGTLSLDAATGEANLDHEWREEEEDDEDEDDEDDEEEDR